MHRIHGPIALLLCSMLTVASSFGKPATIDNFWVMEAAPAVAGAAPGTSPAALSDTSWVADWSFDGPGGCDPSGWQARDNFVRNDGSNFWQLGDAYSGQGGITGRAAILRQHDLCWTRDGYGNDWDYALVLEYGGAGATLSLDFLCDSEPGFDFVSIEADSLSLSNDLYDFSVDPYRGPAGFRRTLLLFDGPQLGGQVMGLALPDFGLPAATHSVYIRFTSDGNDSDQDGGYPSAIQAGLVVDNVTVTGAVAYAEDFEGATPGVHVQMVNAAPARGYGLWARLFAHPQDLDRCYEDMTCAWVFNDPGYSCGASEFLPPCVRPNLDNVIESPWVELAGAPAGRTVLSFREWLSKTAGTGCTLRSWGVRARLRRDNTDTPAPGDSVDCATAWASGTYAFPTNSSWTTNVFDVTGALPAGARAVQVRFRVFPWNSIHTPPLNCTASAGPIIDRVRVGRVPLAGPWISEGSGSRSQAQDAFSTVRNGILPGEHYSPSGDRFGSAAFSAGADLGAGTSWNLITADSIWVEVSDVLGHGGITGVQFHGAVVAGLHAGKAPAPWSVGANGFFVVPADSVRDANGEVVANRWCVDLDDDWFRGGDVLVYFWSATDAAGGFASNPRGLDSPPASVADAEAQTGGLLEVSSLPAIDWAPAYLARVAADPHGDVAPTPEEIAASAQKTCILYDQLVDTRRRSGEVNRTALMWALDRLGYRGHYDVYDHQGYGNTNNQLAGRASVAMAAGYSLIVQDTGRLNSITLPNGGDANFNKVDQAQFYRDYLAASTPANPHSLWILGENVVAERGTNPLFATDLGVALATSNVNILPPDVLGQTSFTWANGTTSDFAGQAFALQGGCPALRSYDGLAATTSTLSHRYASRGTLAQGATTMRADAARGWNGIMSSFNWFDIRETAGSPPDEPGFELLTALLGGVLPSGCQQSPSPTDAPPEAITAAPGVSTLYPNVPNPFNPSTTIRFDVAKPGALELAIFDVAGRRVQTLLRGTRAAGRNQNVTWNGMDEAGAPVPSGIYFCRLEAPDRVVTRRLVLLK